MKSRERIWGLAKHPDRVRLLQNVLRTLGFSPGPVDGVFTPQTIEALRRFQRRYGVDATGKVDGATWELLEKQFVNEMTSTARDTPVEGVRRVEDMRLRVTREEEPD